MSEVGICNVALAYLGEPSIQAFGILNKRERLCGTLYPICRDSNLGSYDWSFARATVKLNQLDEEHYLGYVYQKPADCLAVVSILPESTPKIKWYLEADKIILPYESDEWYLQYTKQTTNTSLFSVNFKDVLSLDLAVRMCNAITQNDSLRQGLAQQLEFVRTTMMASDANRGSDFKLRGLDNNYDSYVNPLGDFDGSTEG